VATRQFYNHSRHFGDDPVGQMMNWSQIWELLGAGTLGGFAAGQVSRLLIARDDRRGHLGRALADLLDVRYQALMIAAVQKEMAGLTDVPLGPQIYPVVHSFLPDSSEIHARYDGAVSAIAAFDPLLAYQLRSKDTARSFLTAMGTVALRDEPAMEVFARIEPVLRPEIQRALEDAILLLARKHGLRTWLRTKRVLRRELELPDDVRETFRSAVAAARALASKVAPTTAAAAKIPSAVEVPHGSQNQA
jgi:hypothetical protein